SLDSLRGRTTGKVHRHRSWAGPRIWSPLPNQRCFAAATRHPNARAKALLEDLPGIAYRISWKTAFYERQFRTKQAGCCVPAERRRVPAGPVACRKKVVLTLVQYLRSRPQDSREYTRSIARRTPLNRDRSPSRQASAA